MAKRHNKANRQEIIHANGKDYLHVGDTWYEVLPDDWGVVKVDRVPLSCRSFMVRSTQWR